MMGKPQIRPWQKPLKNVELPSVKAKREYLQNNVSAQLLLEKKKA